MSHATYVSPTGDAEVDGLLFGTRWGSGAGVSVTYSFPGFSSQWDASYGNPGEPNRGFAPLGGAEQQALRNALLSWSSVADIRIIEVADDALGAGTLRFAYTTWGMDVTQMAFSYAPNESASGGDVWLNAALSSGLYANLAPGTLGNYVLVHEAGHALGLKHPHEASDYSAATVDASQDSIFNSVMSYYAWPGVALTKTNIDRLPSGLMALDIDALQALYGANATYRSGDDTYFYDGNDKYLETLYDTGGDDTIQLLGAAGGEIDLRPDEWSRLGQAVRINDGAIQNPNTVRIHRGTQIENAIGGDGNDTLIGNDAANRLTGGGGGDSFVLGTGSADTITDFNAGEGDRIDVSQLRGLFSNVSLETDLFSAGYLRLVQQSQDTVLEYDTDGLAILDTWRSIVMLANTNASSIASASFVQASLPGLPQLAVGLTLTGTDAADTLTGGVDDDTIFGLGGDDILDGGLGNDALDGGLGDDVFNLFSGPGGSSTIAGGGGQDTYRFLMAGGSGTTDRSIVVTDFAAGAGGDLIDLVSTDPALPGPMIVAGNSGGYSSGNPFDAVLGYLRLVQSGADTLLQWDRDGAAGGGATWVSLVTLRNIAASSLSANNFAGAIAPDGSPGSSQIITGTSGNDTLSGGVDDDTISGLGGNDVLDGGLGGADVLDGGAGSDTLIGGAGNDSLDGGAGDDVFNLFSGPGGSSTIAGGGGQDTYRFQMLAGGTTERNFVVTDFAAGAGGDLIDLVATDPARPGPMVVAGNSGGYSSGNPFDAALGYLRLVQSGADTLLQWDLDGAAGGGATWVSLATLQGVVASSVTAANFAGRLVVGTAAADTLTGTWANDTIQGLGGDDVIDGLEGADTLAGGAGADTYYVDNSGDLVVETDNTPSGTLGFRLGVDLSSTIDTVIAGGDYTLSNYVENLTLATGTVNLTATGNLLDNALTGNAGANRLAGDAGNDTLKGGAGDDTLDGGPGTDSAVYSGNFAEYTITYQSSAGAFTVTDHTSGRDGTDVVGAVERFKFADAALPLVSVNREGVASYEIATPFSGTPIIGIQIDYEFLGAATGEVGIGTDANDFINLLGGDDTAAGGGGNDILDGGTGSNFLSGNQGTDTFFLDGRGGMVTWSTITDWTAGEQLSVWGWKAESRVVVWRDDGAAGFTGITMHADVNNDGTIDTSVTWTGQTQAGLPTPGEYATQELLWFT